MKLTEMERELIEKDAREILANMGAPDEVVQNVLGDAMNFNPIGVLSFIAGYSRKCRVVREELEDARIKLGW